MNPSAEAATPADGRTRLMVAHEHFEASCRALAARHTPMRTPMFGAVAVQDFIRFMELHTRHHSRQIVQAFARAVDRAFDDGPTEPRNESLFAVERRREFRDVQAAGQSAIEEADAH